MPDPAPAFLGLVRFGAGDGCPCSSVSGGWRVVQGRKIHQGWPYYIEDGALNACLSLDAYGPALADWAGSRAMDRWSGLSTGSPILTPSGTLGWSASGARAIDASNFGGGSLVLGSVYTFAALQEDCLKILDSPLAHPIGLAERRFHVARVAEAATSAVPTAPFNVTGYVDEWAPRNHFSGQANCVPAYPVIPGPVDGRIVVLEEPGRAFTTPNRWDIRTEYLRHSYASRERLWVGTQGFFSVTRSIRRLTWFSSEEVLASSPREYFFNQAGWLVVDSGAIADAWESYATTTAVYGYAEVRVGDRPPSGVAYTTITGPGAGGSSC